jgi:hypothetical protein
LTLPSVSLALHIREVRYYSLVILLTSLANGLYILFRFRQSLNPYLFAISGSILMVLLFNTFSPAFIISFVTIGLSELFFFITNMLRTGLKKAIRDAIPATVFLLISLVSMIPLFYYFNYFGISKAISVSSGFSPAVYKENLITLFTFLSRNEHILLLGLLNILIFYNFRKWKENLPSILQVAFYLSLFLVISPFVIARIPHFAFTRYIIFLQPVISAIIVLDLFYLLGRIIQNSMGIYNWKVFGVFILFVAGYGLTVGRNYKNIKMHVYEMIHPYKGPLDYTIPFIKDRFSKPDTLIIAANYEETSYMFYLNSKVIIGFAGNNLDEDSNQKPHIIAYRKPWENYHDIFNNYFTKWDYAWITFPVFDYPYNNLPELNLQVSGHLFMTFLAEKKEDETYLFILRELFPHDL